MYQKQHFAKEGADGSHEIPGWAVSNLVGNNCGPGYEESCADVGSSTFNYSWIYPTGTYGANPSVDGVNSTIEDK